MRDVKEVFSALKENLDQMMANLQDGVMLFTSDFNAVLVSASAERFIGKAARRDAGTPAGGDFFARITSGARNPGRICFAQAVGLEEIEDEQGRHIQVSLDFIEERGERIGALLDVARCRVCPSD